MWSCSLDVTAMGKRALFGQVVEVSRLLSDNEGAANTRQSRGKTPGDQA